MVDIYFCVPSDLLECASSASFSGINVGVFAVYYIISIILECLTVDLPGIYNLFT